MSGITLERVWLAIGFLSQGLFTARFLVQWVASERKRDSVVPVAFWWLSLLGGLMLLGYAVHRQDPVFIVGQAAGVLIYVRNLMLITKGKRRVRKRAHRAQAASSAIPRPHVAVEQTSVTASERT